MTALEEFIETARWFGGKGRTFKVVGVRQLGWLNPEGTTPDQLPAAVLPADTEVEVPHVRIELVSVEYDDPSTGSGQAVETETYQVPLAYYREVQQRLEHALVEKREDPDLGTRFVYDALHDRYATALWLSAFAEGQHNESLSFHRLPGHDLDLEVHSTLYSGEQSNSSVLFGDDSLMKVFRKVTPGRNPDIEVHEALTKAGNEHVAALYGWLEATSANPVDDGADSDEPPLQLAMLLQFLRTASDGWDLALASVRDLFAEADLHADEVGGDFAAESHRLGVATAEVHEALAEHFPSQQVGPEELAALSAEMNRQLTEAVRIAPVLEEHAEALRGLFGSLTQLSAPIVVQRIHGDLHLGQILRTVKGWKIVDFEGEPAKPLAERTRPDSAWRDVAGMLRSFDYAAHSVEADVEEGAQIAYRAAEWVERNQAAFLDGYLEATGGGLSEKLSADQRLLLQAYVADKAVYETVYETRNRPGWVPIPLSAIARLTAEATTEETSPA
ncbi:MAG: hypothetical protein M3393_00250 [Actinomycetota bacterium]|nr:hypothetical protein [Actinomycetota bacterium]